jgi:hypothetical protein
MKNTLGNIWWMMICLLPVAAYLSYTNGDLWPASIFLMFSFAVLIVARLIEKRQSKTRKEI